MKEWACEAESTVAGTVCCCQWSTGLSLLSVSVPFSVKGNPKVAVLLVTFC